MMSPWLEDSNDAMLVADKLGILLQTVDLERTTQYVSSTMFDEYSAVV
jgi:tRNA-specific 2-thiouridylase